MINTEHLDTSIEKQMPTSRNPYFTMQYSIYKE